MPMTDFLKTKFFMLLTETSSIVPNDEMQNAYEEFIKYIVTTSNSGDYSSVFRSLNFIRIEIVFTEESYQYKSEKKYVHIALYS